MEKIIGLDTWDRVREEDDFAHLMLKDSVYGAALTSTLFVTVVSKTQSYTIRLVRFILVS